MQHFVVTIMVVVNTAETVSSAEVRQEVEELIRDFDGGTAEVLTVEEQ
jgi:hypothetical protein